MVITPTRFLEADSFDPQQFVRLVQPFHETLELRVGALHLHVQRHGRVRPDGARLAGLHAPELHAHLARPGQ